MLQNTAFSRLIQWMCAWLVPPATWAGSLAAAALLSLGVAPIAQVQADAHVPHVTTVAQASRAESRRAAADQDRERACAPFLAWAADGPVPYYGGFRAPPDAIVAFLRADRFVPHFGKRYEDLNPAELQQLSKVFGRCFHSNGPTSKIDARIRTLMGQALKPSDQPAHKQYLAAATQTDATLLTLATEASALEPTKDGFDRWLSIVDQAAAGFMQASPATRQEFERSMKKADATVVAAVLPQVVDEAMKSATGLDGLRSLYALAQQPVGPKPGSPMSVLSDEGVKARQESRRRLQERSKQIAAQVAVEEGARIDAFAQGLAGLEQGRLWHTEYQTNIAPYAGHASELGQLQPRFMTLREAALLQSQAELLDLIRMAPDRKTLTALQARYLLKEDLTTAPGNAVASAVSQRAHEIDRAVALGRPAAPSAEIGGAARQQTQQKSGDEPSEEVMYDLIRSVLDDATEKQNAMTAQCMQGVRQNDPLMNQACAVMLLYKGATTGITTNARAPKILEFEKLGCAPAVGKAGYMCDYTLAVEQQLNASFVGPEAKALLEGAELKSARFIESRKGWRMIYTDDAVR